MVDDDDDDDDHLRFFLSPVKRCPKPCNAIRILKLR